MRRGRKIVYGLIAAVALIAVLEASARAYSAIRFRNVRALSYGWDMLVHLRAGTEKVDARRQMDEATRRGLAAERLFERRNEPGGDGLVVRAPRTAIVNGRPARINSFGYRGPEFPAGEARRPRIGAFGGSDVWGAYLEDDETWTARLGSALERDGFPVDVLNGATNGATIHGVLEDMIRVTNRVRLHYAIVMSGYNNHPLVPVERRYSIARNIDFYLYNLSMLHVLVKEKIGRLQGQPVDYGLYHQVVRLRASDVDDVVALFRRRLDQIAALCRERGVTLILASQGEVFFAADLNRLSSLDADAVAERDRALRSRGELYLADLDYYLQGRFNLEVRAAARDLGVPFFDGAGVLERDRPRHFVDEIHPGPEGARALAAALVDALEPRLADVSIRH